MLADLLFEALRKRDHFGLFLILWILIPLPIVYYVQLPAKYLLPCMPAVILLCFRLMDGFSIRIARVAAVALIVASTGYSLLILHSDAEFAEFGRDAMYRLISPHVAAGERVWFGGQYWSYWYAPLAGATLTFPGGPQPRPGDLLVVGRSDEDIRRWPVSRIGHWSTSNPQVSIWKNHGSWNRPLHNMDLVLGYGGLGTVARTDLSSGGSTDRRSERRKLVVSKCGVQGSEMDARRVVQQSDTAIEAQLRRGRPVRSRRKEILNG